jgi:hypothetical protein
VGKDLLGVFVPEDLVGPFYFFPQQLVLAFLVEGVLPFSFELLFEGVEVEVEFFDDVFVPVDLGLVNF